jgi:hypothetical protein
VHDLAVTTHTPCSSGIDDVAAAPTAEAIVSGATGELVVAGSPEKTVVAGSAVEAVGARPAVKPIAATQALQGVITLGSAEKVVSVRALDEAGHATRVVGFSPGSSGQHEHCGRKRTHDAGQPPVGARADHGVSLARSGSTRKLEYWYWYVRRTESVNSGEFLRWARLDSNQGPTDYESAALTS